MHKVALQEFIELKKEQKFILKQTKLTFYQNQKYGVRPRDTPPNPLKIKRLNVPTKQIQFQYHNTLFPMPQLAQQIINHTTQSPRIHSQCQSNRPAHMKIKPTFKTSEDLQPLTIMAEPLSTKRYKKIRLFANSNYVHKSLDQKYKKSPTKQSVTDWEIGRWVTEDDQF